VKKRFQSLLFQIHNLYRYNAADINGKKVLFVWDGSDAQPFPPQLKTGIPGDSQHQEGGGGGGGGGDAQLLNYGTNHWLPFQPEEAVTGAELDGRGLSLAYNRPRI
jgi:hypothetical protein